jgi:flagellar protein FlgJ
MHICLMGQFTWHIGHMEVNMEIGRISDKQIINTIDNAKMKSAEGGFEQRLKSAMDKQDEKELKEVCRNFEQIFLSMMYKQMKSTVPKSELLPGDSGRDVFESMLDDSLMEEASKSGNLGLGEMMYKQLYKKLGNTYLSTNGGEGEVTGDKEK